MRPHPTLVLATIGLAALGAFAVATPATAHPVAKPKPTGTIFFFRENSASVGGQSSYSMTAAGTSPHKIANVDADTPVYAASGAHLLAYENDTSQEFVRDIRIATYKGKVTHTYKPNGLVHVNSISPNGKYLGIEINVGAGKTSYEIATIKGKKVATLFPFTVSISNVIEAWSPNSKEVAIQVTKQTPTVTSTLKIYNLHGKVVRTVATNTPNGEGVSWSKSGTIAFTAASDIDTVKATGGTPHVLLNLGTKSPAGVSYSPSGAFLAYGVDFSSTAGPEVEQIWRVDANGKSPHKITGKGTQPDWG